MSKPAYQGLQYDYKFPDWCVSAGQFLQDISPGAGLDTPGVGRHTVPNVQCWGYCRTRVGETLC